MVINKNYTYQTGQRDKFIKESSFDVKPFSLSFSF